MEVESLQSRIRNLESSLVFLKKEHSITLKSLQDEIKKLQFKNSDYSFQLTMGTSRIDAPAAPSQHSNEEEVNDLRRINKQLQARLDMKSSRKRELKLLLATLESRLAEETHTFRAQLDERNAKISTLLDRLSVTTASSRRAGSCSSAGSISPLLPNEDLHHRPLLPKPPREPKHESSVGTDRRQAGQYRLPPDVSTIVGPGKRFPAAGALDDKIRVKASPNVLPPISHSPVQLAGEDFGDSISDDLLSGSFRTSNRPASTSSLPRLERQTLAVQPLTPPSQQYEPNTKPT